MPPSGASWVSQYPTSNSTTTLSGTFRTSVDNFLAALRASGASVSIAATYRPPERAYLMHYAWDIANGFPPANVPGYPGIDIQWVHLDSLGQPDPEASRTAARVMVAAYGIAYRPSLTSRHTQGLAIDMSLSWTDNLAITGQDGAVITISTAPRSGGNASLHAVGAAYGVIKLVSDPPHWSSDGH